MNENIVIDIAREALILVLKLAAPMLLSSLVIGLIISILQTVTSIQEQTLTFVPKLIVIFLVIILFGNWIITTIKDFTIELFTRFGYFIDVL
ncbi:MAG TPA: flagellar biosynthesis protein FliQ [Clostridiales bacterium]|nr:flagellar biosynthesis protein FliQ [Clostridiales bacterium]